MGGQDAGGMSVERGGAKHIFGGMGLEIPSKITPKRNKEKQPKEEELGPDVLWTSRPVGRTPMVLGSVRWLQSHSKKIGQKLRGSFIGDSFCKGVRGVAVGGGWFACGK